MGSEIIFYVMKEIALFWKEKKCNDAASAFEFSLLTVLKREYAKVFSHTNNVSHKEPKSHCNFTISNLKNKYSASVLNYGVWNDPQLFLERINCTQTYHIFLWGSGIGHNFNFCMFWDNATCFSYTGIPSRSWK